MLTHFNIAGTNLDTKRALSSCRAHELCRQDFLYQLRLAQTREPRRGENNCIVLALFQLANSSVNIAAQRMNHKVGPCHLQLSLPPQAASPDERAFWQSLNTVVLD